MNQPKSVDQKKPNWSRTVLLATNSSHSIIAEVHSGKANPIAYSIYGEQSAEQEVATKLGFNGQLREANRGWYLLGNGYRAYNPRLMRFHSPDSWSPFGGGGLNAYMYCVGDPVNRSDPTGHSALFPGLPRGLRKSVSHTVGFFFGGSGVTGPNRRQAIKATSGVEAVAGSMRPENTGERNAVISAGILVSGASGPTGNSSPAIQYTETRPKNHPGYEAGAAADAAARQLVTPSPNMPATTPSSYSDTSGGSTPRSSFDQPRTLYKGPPYVPQVDNNQLQGSGPFTSDFTTTHQPRLTPNPQAVHWNSPSLHQPPSPANSIYYPSPSGSPGSARSWSSRSSTRSRSSRSSYSSSSSSSSANSSIRSW